MSSAMNKLNNALFKAEHKSYYSKQDVDILDEYRTVVPVGLFQSVYDKVEQDVEKDKIAIKDKMDNIRSIFNLMKIAIQLDNPVYNPKVETKEEYKKIQR